MPAGIIICYVYAFVYVCVSGGFMCLSVNLSLNDVLSFILPAEVCRLNGVNLALAFAKR